jgi:hypothetical protein
MTNKERGLFNHAGSVLKLFAEHEGDDKVEALFKFKYDLRITFLDVRIFEWEFLEALSTYCIAKTVTWSITSGDAGLIIKLSTNS